MHEETGSESRLSQQEETLRKTGGDSEEDEERQTLNLEGAAPVTLVRSLSVSPLVKDQETKGAVDHVCPPVCLCPPPTLCSFI